MNLQKKKKFQKLFVEALKEQAEIEQEEKQNKKQSQEKK